MLDENAKEKLINNMVDNLPTLRTRLGVSQRELAALAGVSRSTLNNIENKKRNMTWNMFLSFLLLFTKNKETDKLLNVMEIYTDELNEFIKQRQNKNTAETAEDRPNPEAEEKNNGGN